MEVVDLETNIDTSRNQENKPNQIHYFIFEKTKTKKNKKGEQEN